MAQSCNDGEDQNDIVSTHSLMEETTETITSPPPLPTLPFDVLPEILCRLPVKLLGRLRCLCKFFNSLISDPKFARKHLHLSTKRHHLMVKSRNNMGECVHCDYPITSIFSTSSVVTQTQLYAPGYNYALALCSCDGIFCGTLKPGCYFLWNPSIRKFKLLPPLENPQRSFSFSVSFGYDHFIDNYKVIVVSSKNEVNVNTLGTDYWTTIEHIPYNYHILGPGIFVSGTVNWFAMDRSVSKHVLLSLDLEKLSSQNLWLPDLEHENYSWTLAVLRDCLCVFASSGIYWDVWIMKEYGNKESWTKLYTIPNMQDRGLEAYSALYISEDDQLLVQCYELEDEREDDMKLVVYDSKTGTSNIPEFQNNYEQMCANVYIESLISP